MGRARGVELAGYLSSAVGVGEAARRYVAALRSAGVPVLERDVPLLGRDEARSAPPPGPVAQSDELSFNLLCLNPEQMMPYLDGPTAPSRAGRTTIGIWSWEVDVLPPGWQTAAAAVTEVWTYSRFAAELMEDGLGVPVWGIAPPLVPPSVPVALPFGLPSGFKILMMFDYLSTLERKNPLGAIEAFRRAFEPNDGAVLVVKSVNGRHRPDRAGELARAVEGREDIELIDQTVSAAERDALVAACDCLLSLHRSEGHGLPLAEAMACGKPVVATGYGGNTEFMDDKNSYLVRWAPARVGEQVEHYPAAAVWAEPDLEHAAEALRSVYTDQESAHRRAARGKADAERLLAVGAIGVQMRRRLEELQHTHSQQPRSARIGRKWRLRVAGRG